MCVVVSFYSEMLELLLIIKNRELLWRLHVRKLPTLIEYLIYLQSKEESK